MASTETLQVRIIADASSLSKELSGVSKELKNTEKDLEGLTKVGESFKKVGAVIAGIGIGITGAFAGLVAKGAEWQAQTDATSFLYEKLDKNIQNSIKSNAKNAESIGMTSRQYKEGATNLANYFNNMGFTSDETEKLTGKTMNLAADMAAFIDVPVAEAQEDIRSALLNNYEALDKYGIAIGETTLKDNEYFKSLGKTWNQLSETEKQQVILNEIMEQTAGISGLAAEESDSFASKVRMLKDDLSKMVGVIGSQVLPTLAPFVDKIREVVEKFTDWIEKNPELAGKIALVVGAIGLLMAVVGPLLIFIGSCITAFTTISGVIGGLSLAAIPGLIIAFGNVIAIGAIIVLAIGAIIEICKGLIDNWDQIKANAIEVWNNIKDVISAVAEAIWNVVKTAWDGLKNDTLAAWDFIKNLASTVWNGIKTVVSSVAQAIWNVVTTAWNGLKSDTQNAWNAIKGFASSIWNGIKSTISNVVNGVKSTVSNAWNTVKSTTSSAFNSVKDTARSAFDSVKNFISDKINAAKDKVKSAMDAIKRAVNVNLKPNLKLPHISVSGKLSLNPPSVPKISKHKWSLR